MKFWQLIVLILLIAAIGVGVAIWQPWRTTSRKIDVSAEGKIKAVPDVSKITAGVQILKPTADQAQKSASEQLSKIVEAVKAQGIPENDIKTDNISTNPNYDYRSNNKISGYYGNGTVTVTIREVSKAQAIVDIATASGATSVYGPQLTFSDDKLAQLQNQAREQAVTNAKQKAESLAKTSGGKIGKVLTITETSGNGLYYPMFAAEAAADLKAAGQGQSAIQPGENEITIQVSVSYALK